MERKIKLNVEMEYFDGLYFDTICYNEKTPHDRTVARFVFFQNDGVFYRAMLSNNEIFNGGLETNCIPNNLRFKKFFQYAGLLSPFGYRNKTIADMLDLMNKVFGSWKFEFVEGQTFVSELKRKRDFFLSKNYTSDYIYTGQHCYHHSHSECWNTPFKNFRYRIGVELEVEANNSDCLDDIRKFKTNWFFMERDGSLDDFGVEFITIPLLPKDATSESFWSPLCSELSKKSVSWDSSNCGLHVHIGREILGRTERVQSETLGKLLYLYHHFVKDTPFNTTIYGRSRAYRDIVCKSELVKAVDILGKKVLKIKKFRDAIDEELKDKSNTERYFDINILNANTIEFRRGKGSLNPTRIAGVVQYCEFLCLYAKQSTWETISLEGFIKYIKENIKEENALYRLMESRNLL